MNKPKKTMYEILEISPNASESEIQAAFQRKTQQLQSEKNGINSEDIDCRLKVVNVAFQTLSVPRTRAAYDARLASLSAPANAPASLGLVPVAPEVDAAALKAEAMSLKAEALALKADAVLLRANALTLRVGEGETPSSPASKGIKAFAGMLAPLRGALTIIGSLIAIAMVIQVVFMLAVNRKAEEVVNESAKAEEKVMLQDYYQEHGVRAGSRSEAELLDAERRREEEAQRAKQEQERKYEQFVEDSRRDGEKIAEELRIAEQQAKYEEEQRQRQLEEEKREKEEAERRRVEEEMNRWRR
ncbi:MAG: DnaJ domain-containing protein [Nitrosomonadales bacterium]|nr:DnaJ domain-containing protein [Nitrosomonadales bacterium]